MDRWRTFFGKSGTDIWTLIEQAITVAATDYPNEFKKRRSDIAETLFSRSLLLPLLSDGGSAGEEDAATRASVSMITHVTSNLLEDGEVRMKEENALVPRTGNNKWECHRQRTCGSGNGNVIHNTTRSNTSSINYHHNNIKDNNTSNNNQFNMPAKDMALDRGTSFDQRNVNHQSIRTNQCVSSASNVTLNSKERGSNQSINDASQKIHRHHDQNGDGDRGSDENSIMKELHHIKDVLKDGDNLEEGTILDFMEKLEYMQLSVEMLKSTEIGKDVNGFRKHASKHVRAVVKRLVRNWKEMVDAWAGNGQQGGVTRSTDLSGCKGPPGSNEDQEPENSENIENKNELPANDQSLGPVFGPPPDLFSFLDDEILNDVGGNACKSAKPEVEPVAKLHPISSSVPTRSSFSEEKKVKSGCSLVFKVPKRKDITSEDSDIGSTGKRPDPISRSHDHRRDELSSLSRTTDRLSSGKPSSNLKGKVGSFQAMENSNGNLTLRFANADKKPKPSSSNSSNSYDKSQGEKHSANKRKPHDGYQHSYDAMKRQRGI